MSTKLWIWKQGPFYPELGKKIIELPYRVNPGPSDSQVVISGHHVQPDSQGNFLDCEYSDEEQDAIHTYGIVRMVIDMYEKLLGKSIVWPWNKDGTSVPLQVLINGDGTNCRYVAEEGTVLLDKYGFEPTRIHNCRTVDLVAHETAHAIIHSLKPEWRNGTPETRGIVEAFCDLTAMFWILSQEDMCTEVIKETKGDLRKSNMLSLFAAYHNFDGHSNKEIRNALNKTTYKRDFWDPYFYDRLLVGLLYDVLVEQICSTSKEIIEVAVQLFEKGEKWKREIFNTFLLCRKEETSLMEFFEFLQQIDERGSGLLKRHLKGEKLF